MRAEGPQALKAGAPMESLPISGVRLPPLASEPQERKEANRGAGPRFGLTAPQKAMWLPQILFPGKPVTNCGAAVAIDGPLDPPLFAEAIRLLVEETDALRMSFGMAGDVAYQEVRDHRHYAVERVDLSLAADPEAAARQWIEDQFWRPIDWTQFPAFRFVLIELGADRHIWLQIYNHMLIDAVGRYLLIERTAQIYLALCQDVAAAPDGSSSYVARIKWETRYLGSDAFLRDQRYWAERFPLPPPPLVDADRRGTECARTGRPAQLSRTLSRSEFARLEGIAKSLGSSLPRLLLALVYIAFSRLGGSQDLVLGFTIHNRMERAFRQTIGLLAANVPCRLDIDPTSSFRDALHHVDSNFMRDLKHARFPVGQLSSSLGLSRQGRGLFDVLVNYIPAPSLRDFAGIAASVTNLTPGLTLPWAVTVYEQGASGDPEIAITYDPGLVDAAEALRLSQCLAVLATLGDGDLERPVGSLPIISAEERQGLIAAARRTTMEIPAGDTLASLCADRASLAPHDIAVVCGTDTIDYATLHERAGRLARTLIKLKVGVDSVVGIALPRSIDLVVAVLAVHKAGAAYLPLDPAYPGERIAFIIADARAPVIVTTAALAAKLPNTAADLLLIDRPDQDAAYDDGASVTDERARAGLRPDGLAYVIYTSGSTGRPKGVGVTHRNVVNLILCARTLVEREDLEGVLFSTSLNFDLSVYELFLPLAFGGRLIMIETLLDVATAPSAGDVRLINTGPTLMESLLARGGLPPRTQTVNLCGEPLSRALADRIFAAAPDVRLINFYGPTETTVYSTWSRVDAGDRRIPAIGKGLWNTEVYVLDAGRELLPAGAKGELYIGGQGVSRGYLNRPDLTEERFIRNPFGEGRLYRTGDIVRWRADGDLEFHGRADAQVKINGLRIELGEIESHLVTVPGIAAAAVVVRPDRFGVNRLYSYATSRDGAARPAFEAIKAHLSRSLPRHMIPTAHSWLEALPLTPNRKLDRRALPAPVDDSPVAENLPPRTELERALTGIWRRLLKVEQLGIRDDFFAAGGDSLMVVGLLLEIEKQVGIRLPFDAIYGDVTIERLAGLLGSAGPSASSGVLVPLQPLGAKTPFFCVHGIGGEVLHYTLLARLMGNERPFFGIRAPDLENAKSILGSVETTAALYVKGILDHQPAGPYLVGGLSLGATIAFEIAQQLVQRGHQVGFLALMDQRRRGWALELSNVVPTTVNFIRNIAPWLRHDVAHHGVRELRNNIRRKSLTWIRYLSRFGKEPLEPDVSIVLDLSRYAPDRHELFRVLYAALLAYRPKTYRGRAVVFRAAAQPVFRLWDEPALGWRDLISPAPEVRVVPGNHRTMIAEPHVRALAGALRQALDDAEADGFRRPASPRIDAMSATAIAREPSRLEAADGSRAL